MSGREKRLSVPAILLSLTGFVVLWAVVTDAWGYSSRLDAAYGKYIYACASRLVWVAPAVWIIFRHDACLRFPRKELFSRPVPDRTLTVVLAASLAYTAAMMLAVHGRLWVNCSVSPLPEILVTVLVGVVEETVFRGWGYNALLKAVTDRKAVVYSTAFFVLLHWPAYFIRLFRSGTMDWTAWLMQSLAAAVWGVICCRLLKKGKTLWNPIIAHAVYDILYVFLVG